LQNNPDVERLRQENQQLTNQMREKQQLIDNCEEQLRTVTAEKNEIQQLTDKINNYDNQIQALQTQVAEKDSQIANHATDIAAAQSQSQDLHRQIETLKSENENLVNKITSATTEINEAVYAINVLANNDAPNSDSQSRINDILQQIENSLQNISNSMQQQSSVPARVDNTTDFQINLDGIVARKNLLSIKELLRRNPEYTQILENINRATTPEQIQAYLENVTFSSSPSGGRKTKKLKKIKGGFTYKTTSRRKSISSIPNYKYSRHSRRKSR
jgi:chromosome segregation ATPase